MQSITELTWNNQLTIMESVELKEKKNNYEVKFRYSNGYTRTEFVEKENLAIPFVEQSTWKNVMYVNTNKYLDNPELYHKLIQNFREKNDSRKWLKIS